MARDKQRDALQTIFSFFLGLMVLAFIGVGVNAFYPAPVYVGMEVWTRNTSIVLILFATAVMGVSLVRSEQLRVISNGLLLGGLFTMVYGSGWVVFSGSSTARFFVILFALAVSLGLGWLKFVRGRQVDGAAAVAATSASGGALDSADVAALAARVDALERRAAAAAAALGAQPEDRESD
jgi:hypothetical protein